MKLVVVQESFQDEELTNVTSVLTHGLAARNHNITLVVLTGKPVEPVDLSHYSPRITPIFMEKTRASAASSGIARLVERERPDLVVSHGTSANIATLAGMKARGRSAVPVVILQQAAITISPHLSEETRRNTAAIAVPTLYKDADLIICALQSIAETMELTPHINSAKLRIIHNPLVEMNVFETAAEPIEEEWFDARGANKLVSTGPLSNRKMHQSFLQAIALARYHENLRAFILGEGELHDELSVLATNLALEDIVTIPGAVTKPERFMRAANAYISTAQHDYVPADLVRAMALGTPVIALDAGAGTREVLANVRNGWCVSSSDPEQIAETLLKAIKAGRSDDTLATRARDFSRERVIDTYERCLMTLLSESISNAS